MKKQVINYETLLSVTKAISHSRDPEEVVLMTVESIKTALFSSTPGSGLITAPSEKSLKRLSKHFKRKNMQTIMLILRH